MIALAKNDESRPRYNRNTYMRRNVINHAPTVHAIYKHGNHTSVDINKSCPYGSRHDISQWMKIFSAVFFYLFMQVIRIFLLPLHS